MTATSQVTVTWGVAQAERKIIFFIIVSLRLRSLLDQIPISVIRQTSEVVCNCLLIIQQVGYVMLSGSEVSLPC